MEPEKKSELVLVPREPTVAMLAAAVGEIPETYSGKAEKHYRAMWRLMVAAGETAAAE